MWRLVLIYVWLAGHLQLVRGVGLNKSPTLGSKHSPRLLSQEANVKGFEYQTRQKHSVLFYHEESGELYVGGQDFVFKLDANDCRIIEKFHLNTAGQEPCEEGLCENVITVIEKFEDNLFVCRTNGRQPKCWKIVSSVNNQSHQIVESYEGAGISPSVYTQNSVALTVEGDLYAAVPLYNKKNSSQLRRKLGKRKKIWMYEKWVSEPTFISLSWVKQKGNPDNEKIYIFFREKNSDLSPEADPWISRVARVCKVDEGGSKQLLQGLWTSFLKARIVCGYPGESLYFNHLQDIYVMHADDWRSTRVYALFSSSWNSTAVCIYTVGEIEDIFSKSSFKGYNNGIPTPRPGACVRDSVGLPLATLTVMRDHPEMTDWVHSVQSIAPVYVSSNNYTKIAADQVQALDQEIYNVLFLATDSGKIHKILATGSEPLIISETELSNSSTVQSMKFDSKKKKLVVAFSEKVVNMDLQNCREYNKSCADCVLAQDPYCAWTEFGCTPTVPGGTQNVVNGQTSVCSLSVEEQNQGNRDKREIPSSLPVNMVHSVPLGVPFYLSCPIGSYHAVYTWEHREQSSPCLQMQSNCLHLIPAMAQENYGIYECIAREKDHTKVVKRYHLTEQEIQNQQDNKNVHRTSGASAVVWQILYTILGLALAVLH